MVNTKPSRLYSQDEALAQMLQSFCSYLRKLPAWGDDLPELLKILRQPDQEATLQSLLGALKYANIPGNTIRISDNC